MKDDPWFHLVPATALCTRLVVCGPSLAHLVTDPLPVALDCSPLVRGRAPEEGPPETARSLFVIVVGTVGHDEEYAAKLIDEFAPLMNDGAVLQFRSLEGLVCEISEIYCRERDRLEGKPIPAPKMDRLHIYPELLELSYPRVDPLKAKGTFDDGRSKVLPTPQRDPCLCSNGC